MIVKLIDGPAQGFEYETMIHPTETIYVAPLIQREGAFRWVRVLEPRKRWWQRRRPWPDQATYRFCPTQDAVRPDVLEYEHRP